MSSSQTQADRVKRYVADRLEGIVRRQVSEATSDLRDMVGHLQRDLVLVRDRVAWLENEVHRLGPHLAAQGERIGILEQGYRPVATPDLQAAAMEHARARARGALVSEYEERINRLELRLAGDQDA